MSETIAVFGATGTIGQYLIPKLFRLLDCGNTDDTGGGGGGDGGRVVVPRVKHVIRAVTRDKTKALVLFPSLAFTSEYAELVIVEGNVTDSESYNEILSNVSRLFLLTLTSLGSDQCSTERKILKALASNNAAKKLKHIVRLSAYCRVMEGQPSNSPFRWHSDCDEQLISMTNGNFESHTNNNEGVDGNINTSNITTDGKGERKSLRNIAITILRPSLFLQDMARSHFSKDITNTDTFYQLGKLNNENIITDGYRIAQVDARDIASVAAIALTENVNLHKGNTYNLTGPRALNWGDIALAISRVVGRKITTSLLNDVEFYKRFGNSHVYLKQMQAYRCGFSEDIDGDIEIVTGRKAIGIEEFVESYKGDWVAGCDGGD